MRPALILATLAAMASLSVAHAQAPIRVDVKRSTLAQTIDSDLSERVAGGWSGAIIVEHNGELVLKAGYGWANRAQLLTHTAGLPPDCGDDFDRVSREDLVSRCLANLTPPATPTFVYSNLGFSLLAAVVESVSGRPLEDYLADRFFEPLRMTRTGYFFGDAVHDSLASGDTSGVVQPPISDRLRALAPAFWNLKGNGGMQASAEDMYTWYQALSNGPVITASMKRALITPHVRRDDEVSYGYGWFVRVGTDGQVVQVSHTGSDGVFFSAFVWRPLDRFFYYLVTSTGEKTGAEAASLVLRRFRESTSKNR